MNVPDRGHTSARSALLEDAAGREGRAWARWWQAELRRQQRRVCGGWPGTLSEARARITIRIAADLGAGFGPTGPEIDGAARSLYDTARQCWNRMVEPGDEP